MAEQPAGLHRVAARLRSLSPRPGPTRSTAAAARSPCVTDALNVDDVGRRLEVELLDGLQAGAVAVLERQIASARLIGPSAGAPLTAYSAPFSVLGRRVVGHAQRERQRLRVGKVVGDELERLALLRPDSASAASSSAGAPRFVKTAMTSRRLDANVALARCRRRRRRADGAAPASARRSAPAPASAPRRRRRPAGAVAGAASAGGRLRRRLDEERLVDVQHQETTERWRGERGVPLLQSRVRRNRIVTAGAERMAARQPPAASQAPRTTPWRAIASAA